MIQFHFRGNQVVSIRAQVGGEESLDITFSFNGVTDGGIFFVGLGDEC